MPKTISDLWYGNLNPCDRTLKKGSRMAELVAQITIEKYFGIYDNKQIIMPEKFIPNQLYLEYHNDVIFQG